MRLQSKLCFHIRIISEFILLPAMIDSHRFNSSGMNPDVQQPARLLTVNSQQKVYISNRMVELFIF